MVRASSCFARMPPRLATGFRLQELMVWILILSLTLAAGGHDVQVWMAHQRAREAEYAAYPDDLTSVPLSTSKTLWMVWQHFSLERKILFAGAGTMLSEALAAFVIIRLRRKPMGKFGHTLSHPIIRRFWYESEKCRQPALMMVPMIIAASYLVVFGLTRMMLFMCFRAGFEQVVFTEPDNAGISLSLVLRLVDAALFTYLLVHVVCGLIPQTARPRYERFLLLLAALVVAESANTIH